MKKKSSVSLAHAKQAAKNVKHISDKKIDFSDIPESTDEELARARRVGRPKSTDPKQLIAIRIHPKLLLKLKRLASEKNEPYQTFIHDLLEKAVKKSA